MANQFDTTNAPTHEPVQIVAGDYTSWKRTDLGTDYPNTSYTLKYEARREGKASTSDTQKISITASADGDHYLVELSTAVTGAYATGFYRWVSIIVRNSDSAQITLDEGRFEVVPNKASNPADPRSHNQRMVDLIKAALEERADNRQLDVLAYDLGVDASATRDTAKLLKFLTTYETRLRQENRRKRARKGLSSGSKIGVKF